MKKTALTFLSLIFCQFTIGQVGLGANSIYPSLDVGYPNQARSINNAINIKFTSETDMLVSVKGLANVKADAFVAIFSITQTGKTAQEVNELIDKRIAQSLNEVKLKKNVETFVDMISFVPIYEFEVEKKAFSRKTYNEVPIGFELKKNIHIKFYDSNQLNDFITILSNNEIYDLARMDYFSNELETIKKEMMNKAKFLVQEKIKNYEVLLGENFTNADKKIIDDYGVTFPIEMYKSYEAYNSSSLNIKKNANVNQASKSTTLYYQPILEKEFDFVMNPAVLEPVIQVQYEIKIAINREKKQTSKSDKEFVLVTPNGDLKTLNINTQTK
jgi:uncharacterized protein YggE